MIISTPQLISSEIRKFCKQITANAHPFYLKVEPAPESIKLECFPNVDNFISKNGGSVQYGWRIAEWSGVMMEAEFHAVWRSSDGSYRDVTPFVENPILFLLDNARTYQGKQISNIRYALSNNPLIHEFIAVNNQIFEVTNQGNLAEKHGKIPIPAHLIRPLQIRSAELFMKIYKSIAKPNSPCICGRGRKYKKCCFGKI